MAGLKAISAITQNLQTPDPNSKPNDPEYLWDVNAMAAVIAAKKESRNVKGQVMNCFVLKTDHAKNDDELIKFLDNVKANIGNLEGQRFQLACQSGDHWFPVDMQIKNGKVQAIIMEAGFSPCTGSTLNKIKARFDDAEVYTFLPDDVKIAGRNKTRMLQADNNSCSRFTLEHLFHMQTRDMFAIFEANKQAFAPPPRPAPGVPFNQIPRDQIRISDEHDYYQVTPANMPKEAAFLFRDTQSLSIVGSLSDDIKNHVVNKKGETLQESVSRHTEQVDMGEGKMLSLNKAVAHFREKKVEETVRFLEKKSEKEVAKILSTRDGTDFITKGQAYRDQVISEQLALAKPYTTILKDETEKTKSSISKYAQEAKGLLTEINEKNPDNEELIESIDKLISKIEEVRVQSMEITGSTFHNVERKMKEVHNEFGEIQSDIERVHKLYQNEINGMDIANLNDSLQSIRDSLVSFRSAEMRNAKISDYVSMKIESIKNAFTNTRNGNRNEHRQEPIASNFAQHSKEKQPLSAMAGIHQQQPPDPEQKAGQKIKKGT